MIHENKEEFVAILERAAKQKAFLLSLIEKDYYLTLILSKIKDISEDMVFKGGTCLNKIYFDYYRLSEDLDFTMILPSDKTTRSERRRIIQPVKEGIDVLAKDFGMRVDHEINNGHNESKQYVFNLLYTSVVHKSTGKIKIEIGLRNNPILAPVIGKVQHAFLHPFTGLPLFEGGNVKCLALNELLAEKLRAAAIRLQIAPRDFFDLDFVLRNNPNLISSEVISIFQKKLEEDNASTNIEKYRQNLGRRSEEINDMHSRIDLELFDVLTLDERKNFHLDSALERINLAMANMMNDGIF